MVTEHIEEYLEALYIMTEGERPARTTDISNYLKIKPASVTEMIQKLSAEGYVNYEPYHGVTLTDKGLRIDSFPC